MNETEMYAAIGRKQTELDNLNTEYDRLLAITGQIVSGEIPLDRVSIDLAARTWAVSAAPEVVVGTAAAEPGQQLQ